MILAVAIDAFSQQALRYYNCWTLDLRRNASIPVYQNHVLDPTSRKVPNVESQGQAAIIEGLIRDNEAKARSVVPDCPSGMCNFTQSYSSLGFCSSCHNVVHDLTATLVTTPSIQSEGANERLLYDHPIFTRVIADLADDDSDSSLVQYDTALLVVSERAFFLPDSTERGPYTAYKGHIAVVDNWNNPVPLEKLKPYSMTTNGPPIGYTMYIAPTFDSKCTFDWMYGGEKQPTDCVAPSMIANSSAKGYFNAFDPGSPQWTNQKLLDYPNVTSSLCSLSYCVKTYNASIQNGVLTESVLNESAVIAVADRRAGSPKIRTEITNVPGKTSRFGMKGTRPWDVVQLIASPCILGNSTYHLSDFIDIGKAEDNGFLPTKDADDSLVFTPLVSSGNFTGLRNSFPDEAYNRTILDSCSRKMDSATDVLLGSSYQNVLQVYGEIQLSAKNGSWGSRFTKSLLQEGGSILWDGGDDKASFYNEGLASNIAAEAVMSKVAEAMTTKLRTLDVNNSVAYGNMYVNQTCVRVVWPWLVLPTILIIVTCCFLIATILRTSGLFWAKQGIRDTWKSNQLAVLLHGLSRETRNVLGDLTTIKEMEKEGKNFKVKLGNPQEGWVGCSSTHSG